MGLKEVIEKHPLSIICGIIVSTAGLTATVSSSIWQQRSALSEVAQQIKFDAERRTFTDRITDLESRLVSIERRVGDDRLFLDVAGIPISRGEARQVALTHGSFADGQAFLQVPEDTRWTFKLAQPGDSFALVFGEPMAKLMRVREPKNQIGEADIPTELWFMDAPVTVAPNSHPFALIGERTIESRPVLSMTRITKEFIAKSSEMIAKLANDSENAAIHDAVLAAIEREIGDEPRVELLQIEAAQNRTSEEVMKRLERYAGADIAGFFLMGGLGDARNACDRLLGGTFRILASEKKGNVMYLHTQCIVRDRAATQPDFVLETERYFIGTSDGGLAVSITVPSRGHQSDAHAWTQAWLTSLRVLTD